MENVLNPQMEIYQRRLSRERYAPLVQSFYDKLRNLGEEEGYSLTELKIKTVNSQMVSPNERERTLFWYQPGGLVFVEDSHQNSSILKDGETQIIEGTLTVKLVPSLEGDLSDKLRDIMTELGVKPLQPALHKYYSKEI